MKYRSPFTLEAGLPNLDIFEGLPPIDGFQFADSIDRSKADAAYARYRKDPVAYSREVLGVTWWSKQIEVAEAILKYPKVSVRAGHATGKDHVAGGLVNWHFDCFDPGLTLTTAPTEEQVIKVLWGEVREQRKGRPGLMPKAPEIYDHEKHYAVGYTARDSNAFQGRHEERVGIIFDEAGGVDGMFFDGARGMLTGPETWQLCIYNPLDPACRMYEEELRGGWHIITMSCLEHPNILAELDGKPAPFPKAVRLSYVLDALRDWCTPIPSGDAKATDIEFPVGSGSWYRPGPLFEARVLGRWPTQAESAVWSEGLWNEAVREKPYTLHEPLEIGCDVARFGSDFTTLHCRRGQTSIHHERHNGWEYDQTAGRLKELAKQFCQPGEDPERVQIKIDGGGGYGGGVFSHKGRYRFIEINPSSEPIDKERYPNRRSELWFAVADRCDRLQLDLSRLPKAMLDLIRIQAMAPTWKLDSSGRRVVEPKADMKKRLGYSPDDMDAVNLAYAPPGVKYWS